MKNLRDYDKLTIQEKRQIAAFANTFLGEELAKRVHARKRRKEIALAQRQEENNAEFMQDWQAEREEMAKMPEEPET